MAAEMARRKEERRLWIEKLKQQKRALLPLARFEYCFAEPRMQMLDHPGVSGYMPYKQRTFNLEGQINAQWSRELSADGRLRIQNKLHCCGYYSPFFEATIPKPGCKEAYIDFEKHILYLWYTIAFSLVPLQLVIMLAGLLCSNHAPSHVAPMAVKAQWSHLHADFVFWCSFERGSYCPQVRGYSGHPLSVRERTALGTSAADMGCWIFETGRERDLEDGET
ncbi:hypothetical protein BDR05DRAFT_952362 [Suillus weaverae]|nr:hypothetical protein BDR05DRAFT_952362 [Suillus weaverae]